MYGQYPPDYYLQRATSVPDAELHNIQPPSEEQARDQANDSAERGPTGTTTTIVPSTKTSSEQHVDGTWGKRDIGGPVSHRMAMDDYERMRKQLSNLSQTRTRDSDRAEGQGSFRSTRDGTQRPASRNAGTMRTRSSASRGLSDKDLEAGDAKGVAEIEEEFELGPFIQEGHFEKRTETGESAKKVGVVFRNLTVKGVGSTKNYVRTLPNAIRGTFGPDLYHILCNYIPALKFGGPPPVRTLINGFTGLVRDGEMMLVLGRPGSGCSTFLKTIANQRSGFAEVSGDVKYGGIPADKQHAHYRGEVNYNPEDDQHFPALNVWQTLKFSLLNKTKKRESGEIDVIIRALLKMFGISHTGYQDAKDFEQSVGEQKSKRVSTKSSFTVSFWRQVLACTQREFWLVWGDKPTLWTKVFIIISNGLIVGSLFYVQPNNTESAFSRGGTAFFSILFLSWLQLTELMKAVSGRVVIARHREYAFYRPSAVSIARVIADFPLILVQVIIFTVIMYFMTNLDRNVSKFFIYALFVYVSTINITALYRMLAALSPTIDDAVRFSGTALNLLIIYTGYAIPKPVLISQKIWFVWLYYINPITYSFEAVLTNEFYRRNLPCAPEQVVPQGPGVQQQYQGCAISGAIVGSSSVSGDQYLAASYGYTRSHLWRNLGAVIAFTVLYILITAIASELLTFVPSGGGALVFKKSAKKRSPATVDVADIEKAGVAGDSSVSSDQTDTADIETEGDIPRTTSSESVFSWTNVNYSVPYQGGQRQLLNEVYGYAKPGVMVALMGASGAGKTTLLNTLSQRQRIGFVSGEMLVDGRPLGPEFQRITGFVEQMDLHDATATIREAIEFSAILRQERHISNAEKLAYVEEIIDLLELRPLQDALISSLGVEQRKRVTIGVELAAKPSLLPG